MSIEVELICDLEHGRLEAIPESVTLKGPDETVAWVCPHLPPGGSFQVVFVPKGAGPFESLAFEGASQVGTGNVGPSPKGENTYLYRVSADVGGASLQGKGWVINLSQERSGDPVGCKDPSSGPPCEPRR